MATHLLLIMVEKLKNFFLQNKNNISSKTLRVQICGPETCVSEFCKSELCGPEIHEPHLCLLDLGNFKDLSSQR